MTILSFPLSESKLGKTLTMSLCVCTSYLKYRESVRYVHSIHYLISDDSFFLIMWNKLMCMHRECTKYSVNVGYVYLYYFSGKLRHGQKIIYVNFYVKIRVSILLVQSKKTFWFFWIFFLSQVREIGQKPDFFSFCDVAIFCKCSHNF